MNREELQAVAEAYVDAFRRHDAAALAGSHSIDGLVESPMFATLQGRQAIEESYRQLFAAFPDFDLRLDSVLVDPPRVAMTTTNFGTHVNEFLGLPGTGKHFEFLLARLVTVENGLIARERRIYDFTGFLVQIGILRAKPAKP